MKSALKSTRVMHPHANSVNIAKPHLGFSW